MSVEKRMILAVAVSFVIIVIWTMFVMPSPQTQQGEQVANEQKVSQDVGSVKTDEAEGSVQDSGDTDNNAVANENEAQNVDTIDAAEEDVQETIVSDELVRFTVETNRFTAVLTNENGGSIESFKVRKPNGSGDFYESSFSEEPLDLVADETLQRQPFSMLGTVIRDGNGNYSPLPALSVLQGVEPGSIVNPEEGSITATFMFRNPELGNLTKTFVFRNNSYIFDVRVDGTLFYRKKNEEYVHFFGPGVGDLVKPNPDGTFSPAREANGFLLRKGAEGVTNIITMVNERGPLGEEESSLKENPTMDLLAWVGLQNSYFMTMAFSQRGEGFQPVYRIDSVQQIKGSEQEKYFQLPFVGFETYKDTAMFRVYSGPKDLDVLEQASANTGEKLEDVVSFGWFAFISRPALWVLKQLFSFTHNYGFSIILLTILINILILPLIISQRKSMQAMQMVQPQLKSIQAKYKAERGDDIKTRQDKKQKLNEEMMALYKKEGVNPMGGCLPLLIQMPILFSLFDMFRAAIELRKAPFIFWWQNLSMPDPTYVLPVLMGVAMFLQQRMTPAPTEGQSGALKMLPFVFVFIFMTAPSGLVLYWFTSSLFNLGTQAVMNKINPVKKSKNPAGKSRKPARKGNKK